ncbi:MAG TPA: nucleotidyltransferase family protein [Solirubrobacteraceae bacterium]|nr:nucleotidyltransferase family protein [Solirubrobacteraceae bacterium]
MSAGGLAGLILAGGAGTRFGQGPKLLADLNGRPLLEHAIEAMISVEELPVVVVVLGAQADRLLEEVEFGRSIPVVCPDWDQGLSASLRTGAAAISGAERVVVTLGDSPTITSAVVRRFLDAPAGSRATYGGTPGHPVVIGPEQLSRLAKLRGDAGARDLIAGAAVIECGDLASGRDVDTPADLATLRRVGMLR